MPLSNIHLSTHEQYISNQISLFVLTFHLNNHINRFITINVTIMQRARDMVCIKLIHLMRFNELLKSIANY